MPEMYLRIHAAIGKPEFPYSVCRQLTKNKEQTQNLKKKVSHNRFIKTNQIKFAFKMTQFMEMFLEENRLMKYYMKKHLSLQRIPNMRGLVSIVYTFFE